MDSFDATARKVLDEIYLMEARLTEKIAGRCDGVERRVDAQCDELHSHFTARCYTIQQQADVTIYDESSGHDGYGEELFYVNASDEKPIFDEGPIFDEEPVFEGEPFPSSTDYIDALCNKVADELVQICFEEMPSAPVRGKDALLHELHTCVRDGDMGAVGIYGMAGVGQTAFLKAVTEGGNPFESGLIAKTNRGILYVDEVNLLDDHLVDVLLDPAAPGSNTVERKGIFISHPARFILIPLEIFHVRGMIRPMPWPSFTSSVNYCMNLDARFVWKPPWSLQRYTRASITLHELLTWLGYELMEDLAQQKCGDNCGPLLK